MQHLLQMCLKSTGKSLFFYAQQKNAANRKIMTGINEGLK